MLAELQMWLPSTFEGCQEGPGQTWTQVSGSRSRIDYFGVSSDVPRYGARTKVLPYFDLLTHTDDHQAIEVDVRYSIALSDGARVLRGSNEVRALTSDI